MTELELRTKIRTIKAELDARYKTGLVKIAAADGTPVPTSVLQSELFSLNYKLSKMLTTIEDEQNSTKTPQFP